jgi:hypothetical protein
MNPGELLMIVPLRFLRSTDTDMEGRGTDDRMLELFVNDDPTTSKLPSSEKQNDAPACNASPYWFNRVLRYSLLIQLGDPRE